MYYHNKVKAVQFFPSVSFADKKRGEENKGREGRREKKAGGQAVRASCRAESGPLPSPPTGQEGMVKSTGPYTSLYLPLPSPTVEAP